MMKTLQFVKLPGDRHWVGDGFPVRSVFSYESLGRELDPFLLMDYAEPFRFPPGGEPRGVGAHPHKGFETVTLALQGEVAHGDSHGGGGVIGPGDVQWMTAGQGILHKEFHSEAFTSSGGIFEMVQLWVNLPAKDKSVDPRYQSIADADIPVVDLPSGNGTVRVIAGNCLGTTGPAETFTPIDLRIISVSEKGRVLIPARDGHTTAVFVIRGRFTVEGRAAPAGSLVLFGRKGEDVELEMDGGTRLLFLGGEPIGEPIVGQGPFVMNSRDGLIDAFRQFQSGGMGVLE